jgi:phage baseplate assembly protein W
MIPTQSLGTDIDLLSDLGLSFGLAGGQRNLGNAISRRFQTPRGGLVYDPEYGTDLRAFMNASLTPAGYANLKSVMIAEAEKDPRVLSFTVTNFTAIGRTLTAVCAIDTADGPFDLVLAISDATIEILDAAAPAASALAPDIGGGIVVVTGPMGLQGPAGTAGTGGQGFTLGQAAQMAVTSGNEEIIYSAGIVDFGVLPGSLSVEFTAEALALSGTGTFRVRAGGASTVPTTGTVLASFTANTNTFTSKVAIATPVNPTGQLFVKVTAQNSIIGQDARIRALLVTLR